ncbi:hypothetical protein BH09PSE4_BH09PSE4_02220 [soil metagenome]
MNQHEHLVHMANQIARNFATMGDVDAVAATADHIVSYWDPRMKAAILADPTGLMSTAAAAIEQVRLGAPIPHQTRATESNRQGETGGSDAG